MSTPLHKTPPVGVRVTRGVTIAIPPGGLVLHAEGLRAEVIQLHLRLNLAAEWLEIAWDNLGRAESAHTEWAALIASGQDNDEIMRNEFKASMQAVVAAGTFFESLYALAREAMPANLRATATVGRAKGKRSAIVVEQLKRAFGLRTRGTANLSSVVGEVYRFREETVHPTATFGPPALHPLSNQYVERRIAMFTYPNAKLLVRAALAYAKILPTIGLKQGPKEGHELANYLLTTCEPLFQAWEKAHGPLLKAAA